VRAISSSKNHKVTVRPGKVQKAVDQTGAMVEVVLLEPVLAEFEHQAVSTIEAAKALDHFNFSGIPEGENPLKYLGVWDSDAQAISRGWSDEEKTAYEDALRKRGESMGWRYFIVVEDPKPERPWPTYDEDSPEDIVAIATRLKYVNEAIAYEKDNANRAEVLGPLGVPIEETAPEIQVSV
jgi:hypothetical protein